MEAAKTIFVALGSNQGDRFQNIQSALEQIHIRIGNISKISKIYRCPAVGFEGEEFYNAAVQIYTRLSPSEVMKNLLKIEKEKGRKRKKKTTESRPIDLDLIFYADKVSKSKSVELPHPRMHKRRFVLQPMHDIAASLEHPVKGKSVSDLLAKCKDDLQIEPINIWLKNPTKQVDFSAYNFIAIEGNIGAGKTSLATQISQDFNAKLILERFADNPFLPKFYKEPQRYAFTLEMSFLADRYQQISDDLSQLDLFKDFIVSDYDVYKSLIFSKITLPEDEFILYRKLFYQVYKDIAKPDLYIYLYQNTERLQENIRKRGRNYEQDIDSDYLEKINSGYLEFLRNQNELNVKVIDISEKDFVKHRKDYLAILDEILN